MNATYYCLYAEHHPHLNIHVKLEEWHTETTSSRFVRQEEVNKVFTYHIVAGFTSKAQAVRAAIQRFDELVAQYSQKDEELPFAVKQTDEPDILVEF